MARLLWLGLFGLASLAWVSFTWASSAWVSFSLASLPVGQMNIFRLPFVHRLVLISPAPFKVQVVSDQRLVRLRAKTLESSPRCVHSILFRPVERGSQALNDGNRIRRNLFPSFHPPPSPSMLLTQQWWRAGRVAPGVSQCWKKLDEVAALWTTGCMGVRSYIVRPQVVCSPQALSVVDRL